MMAKILILGAGVMGTAISVPLSDNGHDVRLVGTHLDGDIIEALHQNRQHPGLTCSIPDSVKPYSIQQINQAFEEIDLLVLGVNSLGVRWAADVLQYFRGSAPPLLMLTKGLEGDGEKLLLLPEVFRRQFDPAAKRQIEIAAVGGPSIANELAARRQTSVIVTGENGDHLNELCKILQTDYYHVSISTDLIGVAVSVGLKNLYAIGVGIVQGQSRSGSSTIKTKPMINLEAAIFGRALEETAYIVDVLGGSHETIFSLAGAGDLYVTCQGGRNSQLGRLIGQGLPYPEARGQFPTNETIEGAEIALSIRDTISSLVQIGFFDAARIPILLGLCDLIGLGKPFDPASVI